MPRPLFPGLLAAAVAATLALPSGPASGAESPTPESPDPSAAASRGHGPDPARLLAEGLTPTRTPKLTHHLQARVRAADAADAADAARAFLADRAQTYAIPSPERTLETVETTVTQGTTVVRLQQRYRGLPVLGAHYLVRMEEAGETTTVLGTSGDYFTGLEVDTKVDVPVDLATEVARHSMRPQEWAGVQEVEDHGLVVVPTGPGVVARHLTLSGVDPLRGLPLRREVFVAPGRADPLLAYDNVQADGPASTTGEGYHGPDLPLELYQEGQDYLFKDQTRAMFETAAGEIRTYDAQGGDVFAFATGGVPAGVPLVSSTTVPVPAEVNAFGALDAHWGAGKVYDYYASHGRDGLDGQGGSIESVVNVTAFGQPFPNAFWNGELMVYGSGGAGYLPFAASLDVVGHEMTHGVIDHTSDLLYVGQSGATNEALSDYFGNAIENDTLQVPDGPDDGLMGEDLCVDLAPRACAMRDLNEVVGVDELYRGTGDNGGVHINSPIVAGALWQVREDLGPELADAVVFDVMTQYLTPLSQFLDVREATLAAAQSHGASSAQLGQVEDAFTERGIVPGWEQTEGHVDSELLVRPVISQSAPEGAGDQFVLSNVDLATGQTHVYAGSATRPGSTRLSQPGGDDVYHDLPATDGRTAAWVRTSYGPEGMQVDIRSRGLRSGAAETVADLGSAYVWDLAVDGSTVAWQFSRDGGDHIQVRLPSGELVELPSGADRQQVGPDIAGRYIVYGDIPGSWQEGAVAKVMRYDIRTGTTEELSKVSGVVDSAGYVWEPQIVGSQVYFLSDAQYRLRSGISTVPLRGGATNVVLAEDAELAPVGTSLSVGPRLAAWESFANLDEPTRVYYLDLREGTTGRVSCSVGNQHYPMVGNGERVTWVDTTSSTPDLVTRKEPRGTC